MPGRISTVTISTPDVPGLAAAYGRHLGYEPVAAGALDAAVARLWGLPGLAGRRHAVLAPGGTGDTWLRFVEGPAVPGYVPFRHLGWNAAEHTVQDVDALARRLLDSPFRVIGPPADLSFSDRIRALQVVGPAGEALYLTQIKSAVPGFELPFARVPVDRVFIMILGGADLDETVSWYHERFGVSSAPVIEAVVSVLSNAYGQPAGTLHRICALPAGGQCYIEADQMPAAALPRPAMEGELPPAIAMVTFEVRSLPDTVSFLSDPATVPGPPYLGRRAAVCSGPAGELIELVESAV